MSNEVFSRRSSVFFVCGGVPNAGGCTLEYVIDNSNNGFADFDKSLIMEENGDPIVKSVHGTYDDETGVIDAGGQFNANMVGMICYIADDGNSVPAFTNPGRYEISAADANSITIESGLYGQEHDADLNVQVGGSFDTISNALDNITADDANGKHDCYLFTNTNEIVSARPQVAGGGEIHLNSRLLITGFNTTLLDMMPGGAYYQSAYDVWKNGYDEDCHIQIDLDDINSFVFTCNSVVVQNLRITNHTDGFVIEIASTVRGIVFINCIADDGYNVIRLAGYNVMVCFIGCYIFDSEQDMFQANTLGNYLFIIDCVLHSVSASNQLIRMFWPGRCVVTGSLLISAAWLFLNKGDFIEWNNTVIASSSPVHFCHTSLCIHVGFNDIVILPQDGKFIHMGNLGGCSLLQQFHCLWGDDGEPFTGTYADNDESGGQVSIKNMFSLLEIDPELDGNYRPRNPQMLRGGIPQLSDGLSQLGGIKQKYQFPQKGRIVNHGRLGILK